MARVQKSARPTGSNASRLETRVKKRLKLASQLPKNQNMLFYGEPGTRKTRLAASAPKPLIVDINDQGHDSVSRDFDPMYYPLERWLDLNDIYWFLESGNHDFETVVLDHVTNLQNICMSFVLGDEVSRDASRDPDMPARQAWGKVGQLMKTQLTNFRNLPMNTIFIAHIRANEIDGDDEDGGYIKLGPEVSPSVQKVLTGCVGTIGMMTKKEVWIRNSKTKKKRREVRSRLMIADSEHYISKDRNGVFGDYIDAPDLTEMLSRIYASKEAE